MPKASPASRLKVILSADKNFEVALDTVRKISVGKVWLIGSAVYKNLISDIHGIPLAVKDYDFLVQQRTASKLKGWKSSFNFWGCLKLKKKTIVVDVVALNELISSQKMGKKPILKSFLWQVPFSVQSLAYDVDSSRLIGPGIKDIKNRKIRVNNLVRYKDSVGRWGKDHNVSNVAKRLGLKS